MAHEIAGPTWSDRFASTGIRQHRFVVVKSGGIGYPNASTVGQSVTGVLISSGSTGSTDETQYTGTIQLSGIVKVEAESSTISKGDLVSASSVGRVQSSSNAGDFIVGRCIGGSSGGANRVLTIHLQPLGSTVTPV